MWAHPKIEWWDQQPVPDQCWLVCVDLLKCLVLFRLLHIYVVNRRKKTVKVQTTDIQEEKETQKKSKSVNRDPCTQIDERYHADKDRQTIKTDILNKTKLPTDQRIFDFPESQDLQHLVDDPLLFGTWHGARQPIVGTEHQIFVHCQISQHDILCMEKRKRVGVGMPKFSYLVAFLLFSAYSAVLSSLTVTATNLVAQIQQYHDISSFVLGHHWTLSCLSLFRMHLLSQKVLIGVTFSQTQKGP